MAPRPKPRYEQKTVSVKEHIIGLGRRQARRITWRTGSKQQQGEPRVMSGRFVFARIRQAGAGTRQIYKGQDLPESWLIAEWPPGTPEPTRYWLSTLPADTHRADLVRAAKQRWRIEPDYRELKTGLGLAHYEGRKWAGWHHHVTLVAAAHGFLTLQRLDPKHLCRNDPFTAYSDTLTTALHGPWRNATLTSAHAFGWPHGADTAPGLSWHARRARPDSRRAW